MNINFYEKNIFMIKKINKSFLKYGTVVGKEYYDYFNPIKMKIDSVSKSSYKIKIKFNGTIYDGNYSISNSRNLQRIFFSGKLKEELSNILGNSLNDEKFAKISYDGNIYEIEIIDSNKEKIEIKTIASTEKKDENAEKIISKNNFIIDKERIEFIKKETKEVIDVILETMEENF